MNTSTSIDTFGKVFWTLALALATSLASALQVQLQSPELALSVIATDATRAREFYVESLGLADNGEAANPPPGLRMYLYGSGQATVKVRVYDTDPPGRDPAMRRCLTRSPRACCARSSRKWMRRSNRGRDVSWRGWCRWAPI